MNRPCSRTSERRVVEGGTELKLNRKKCCCSAGKTRTEVPSKGGTIYTTTCKGWHVICIHSNYIVGIVIRIGSAPVITPVYLLLTGISTPADMGANSQVTAGLTPLIPSLTQLQIMKLPLNYA